MTQPEKRPNRSGIFWGLSVLGVIVLVVARLTADRYDFAVANIITLISGFFAWLFAAIAITVSTRFGKTSTVAIWLTPVVLGIIGLILYKPVRVSSELVPQFESRWAVKAPLPAADKGTSITESDPLWQPTQYDYPRFLGSEMNAEVSNVSLSSDWKTTPPENLWRQPIGYGWSGFSVVGGVAITLEQRGEEEAITAYQINDGKVVWTYSYPSNHFNPLGGAGPRSTPTIDNQYVYTVGARGRLTCLKLTTGESVWEKDLFELAGITVEQAEKGVMWGRSGSPLIVEDKVVVPLGGFGSDIRTLIAFQKESGEEIWRAGSSQVSYASPSLGTLNGVPQIISVNESDVSAYAIEDGQTLWRSDWFGQSDGAANCSQAIVIDSNQVFVSKGYGYGCKVVTVTQDDAGVWTAKDEWKDTSLMKTKFANVVVKDGYVYGLSDGILECISLADRKRMWKRGRYQHGQILLVGDKILVVSEQGDVALVEASPKEYNELAKFSAIEGITWNNPTLVNDLLLVRNAEEAAAYRLPLAGGSSMTSTENPADDSAADSSESAQTKETQ